MSILEFDQNGMFSFWNVPFLRCDQIKCFFLNMIKIKCVLFGMCPFWNLLQLNVLFLKCAQKGMSPFWNMIKMKCALFRMCRSLNVTFLECTVVRLTTDGAFFNQIGLFNYTEFLDLSFPTSDARQFLN